MKHYAEKYRPSNFKNIIGNKEIKTAFLQYFKRWETSIPAPKAILLAGHPGIGKTTIALAIAKYYKWDTIVWNSSDDRTAEAFNKIADRSIFQSVGSEATIKLIILDEVDGVRKNTQKSIIRLIKQTAHPVILICNDLNKISPLLKKECLTFKMAIPKLSEIATFLLRIAKTEKFDLTKEDAIRIAQQSGSVRGALNNLELYSEGESIDSLIRIAHGYSEEEMVADFFSGERDFVDVDPGKLNLWLLDNGINLNEVEQVNIILGRIRGNDYRQWKYAYAILRLCNPTLPLKAPHTFYKMYNHKVRYQKQKSRAKSKSKDGVEIEKVKDNTIRFKKKTSNSASLDSFW